MRSQGHGRREEPGKAASKNPPAYGERDVVKVDDGTGEISQDQWPTTNVTVDIS